MKNEVGSQREETRAVCAEDTGRPLTRQPGRLVERAARIVIGSRAQPKERPTCPAFPPAKTLLFSIGAYELKAFLDEGGDLCPCEHARPGAGKPARGTPPLRRGSRVDRRRIRRPRRQRLEGIAPGARRSCQGRQTSQVRRSRVLASRQARPEPASPD